MFPNIRLMIVTVFVSVAALSCGFGVFAAFRVNHEPFVRLPAATTPLLLVAGNASPMDMRLAAGETFGSGAASRQAQIADSAADLSALKPDQRGEAEPPQTVATIAPEPEPAIDPAPPQAAAEPEQPQLPEQLPAAVDDTAAPAQDLQSPETGLETKSDTAAAVTGELSPAAALAPAAVAQPADQDQLVEQTPPEPEVTPPPAAKNGRKIARRIAVRRRVAANPRRVAGWRPRTIAAQFSSQNSAFPQPNFQTALQPAPQATPQLVQRQVLVKRRHSTRRDVARRAPPKRTAVGGPFVSPPPQ